MLNNSLATWTNICYGKDPLSLLLHALKRHCLCYYLIYNWDSFHVNGPSHIQYKITICLNCYNF